MAGLASAAQQLQAYGRAPDTMLAHVSPDEAQFIDNLQGGRHTNPMTGLPEYGLFGDILKAVARVAGAIGGFMVGGPLGAAAGAGITTKLTGGSWKDALTSAVLSGAGGELGQGLTGGGWSVTGAAAPSAAAGAGMSVGTGAGLGGVPATLSTVPAAAGAGAAGAGSSGLLGAVGGWGGAGAGFGALMGGEDKSSMPTGQTTLPPQQGMNLNIVPQPRTYNPYQGDPMTFATPGSQGIGWQFYTPLNPPPQFKAAGGSVHGYAMGGPSAPAPPQVRGPEVVGPRMGMLPHPGDIAAAALMGFNGQPIHLAHGGALGMPHIGARLTNAAHEGPVRGPGTDTSDSIPARLSNNEHVVTAREIKSMGSGNAEKGQKVMYGLRRKMLSNPKAVRALARGGMS